MGGVISEMESDDDSSVTREPLLWDKDVIVDGGRWMRLDLAEGGTYSIPFFRTICIASASPLLMALLCPHMLSSDEV